MSDKKNPETPISNQDEKTIEFGDAKDMTVAQVVKKQKDLAAGIEEEDNVLDRYIKQHRESIEADKYMATQNLEEVAEEVQAEVPQEIEEALELEETVAITPATAIDDLPIHKVKAEEPTFDDFGIETEAEKSEGKNKIFIWLALAVIFVGILGVTFAWMNDSNESEDTIISSSTSASQTSVSSEEKSQELKNFEDLYASFFTDSSLTKIKNSEFDNLSKLKELLDALDSTSDEYTTAKEKYDQLEKAINAIKEINGQFDKAAIVDGELDTTANVKEGAKFESVSTGISAVDTLLTSAVNFGTTQTPASSVAPKAQESTTTPAVDYPTAADTQTPSAPAAPASSGGGTITNAVIGGGSNPLYGIAIPNGVTLQRNLSRVPYDQSKIDDVNNPSWNFNPGVLESIIATSQKRGYITGNQYILEKVNIINGNGYYNLYRPDGTYLFSMNCKTGYFVGNGKGYADDLDY